MVIAKYGPFEYPLAERYRFDDEIGRGAMGAVYRAHDLRLGRDVAIKMLHPVLTTELGARRFEAEIRIAAGLLHPNIAAVHDCGEADGRLFYVMDHLAGETLRARLVREPRLGVADAVAIAEQVAAALHYAHDRQVIHRDVKPENVMLTADRAYVVDFGLARMIGSLDAERLTASGIIIGTAHYLSPEQAEAHANVGPAADQYALGCTLYEMLAGEPPFDGKTATAIAIRHVREEPPPLVDRRGDTPLAVRLAVSRALRKTPAERFPDLESFARALHDDDGAAAARETIMRRFQRWVAGS